MAFQGHRRVGSGCPVPIFIQCRKNYCGNFANDIGLFYLFTSWKTPLGSKTANRRWRLESAQVVSCNVNEMPLTIKYNREGQLGKCESSSPSTKVLHGLMDWYWQGMPNDNYNQLVGMKLVWKVLVVTQLVEQSLPTPEFIGLNTVIDCLLNRKYI